jgi:hypothetical protein
MNHHYQDGAIIISDKYFSDAVYHVSNECISVIFDGKGATVGYALADQKDMMNGCISLFRQNKPIDIYTEKTVAMIGRSQTVTLHFGDAELRITQFLDASLNGVFCSYEWKSDSEKDSITVSVGINKNMIGATLSEKRELRGKEFCFGASTEISFADLNNAVYFDIKPNETVYTFLSCGGCALGAFPIVSEFETYERKMRDEISSVYVPKGLSEEQKALFYSAYFCSLQNYKCLGDYKAFMAGHHYLLPMRSYYRDSYYTVLPMYRQNAELVKEQIITLAKGISQNGDCPSAVKSDYSEWWGNHYDSPSFLSMMLYDYVKHTGDYGFLSYAVDGVSVLEKAEKAINKLSAFADETSLIYKEGPYNQRDWTDEVNRNGYVTYNELLYARALFCLSKLYTVFGDSLRADSYMSRFEKVKNAINDILWDDTLGYYVNFKERDFTEKNLSVDTCIAVLFGIADNKKSLRMLKNMENLLETRNNKEQKAGDYGVMCVYPFYSRVGEARNKSAQPYYYHNGGNWPYLSAMYAAAKRKCGMEYRYALESWFDYNVKRGNYTPVEFFAPPQKDGSLLQAWSGTAAFVMDEEISRDFWD